MNYCYSQQLGRNLLASRFSPLSLSPALWLDASDSATLFNATTGGSLPADGQAIARWEDKSGNGKHATQATGVFQPLRKTSIQNGKDVVRFDGSNDTLVTNHTPNGLDNLTVFFVAKASTSNNYQSLYRSQSGASYTIFPWGGGLWLSDADGTVDVTPTAGACCLCAATRTRNSLVKVYRNGSLINQGAAVNTPLAASSNTYIGSSQGAGEFMTGDISELLVFPTALSDANRQAVEAYLNAKWGVF